MSPLRENPKAAVRLFLLVFLTLYLELGLIRFSSAEVIYLGYFANFVLMAVFLGLGVGFLVGARKFDLFRFFPQAVLAQVAFVLLTRIDVSWLRDNLGPLFFGTTTNALRMPIWVCLPLLFVSTAFVFACVAQETARCFSVFEPLLAYSIDIAGSLAGIVVFTAHARLGGTPAQWFVVTFVLATAVATGSARFNAAFMGGWTVLFLTATVPAHEVRWSPYQRLDIVAKPGFAKQAYDITANGVGHQTMQPVGTKEPMYDWPHRELAKTQPTGKFRRALVIGAGSGTDVSYALHYGVDHVDAVEIDPEILAAGRRHHPEKPYDDPRVTVHINDGRAFMQRSHEKFDLIIFALPDSLALLSGYASVRLESYLFTRESFERARTLLNEDGVLVLYNYYRRAWLVDKLADTLEEAFEHPPVVATFSGESRGAMAAVAIGPKLGGPPRTGPKMFAATDDWPFLYMEYPHVPSMYLWAMLLLVGSAIGGVAFTGNGKAADVKAHMPFFLTGAAFMMLETKSLIQFTLLFGATWLVNALVFAAVLSSVLLANVVVAKKEIRRPSTLFIVLLGSLVLQMVVPIRSLLQIDSVALRYLVASLVLVSPIFFANLVFGYLFRGVEKSASAFGWNIIGTMVGGALDYLAMAVGYQSLTFVIALFYGACALWAFKLQKPAVKGPLPTPG